ncbi:MAG TPA: glycosyltransferase family 4 protein [Actinomycetota bacterium]|nr:glycosyltransferase family 4 protein [Actinomycetota bacterium]
MNVEPTPGAPERPLKIALLSYRAHPEVGGQGVYVRALGRGLRSLGHEVTVVSGPPYPEVDDDVALVRLPSLDLYRPEDPFRRPRLREFRSGIDVAEYLLMCTGAFPEPLTFSLRAAQHLRHVGKRFDVVHDNQCLGYGMLDIARRHPTVTTIHHPISIDRRMALEHASTPSKRLAQRRWYSFVGMQARVARRVGRVITVSESATTDIVADFGVVPERLSVVHNGVDAELFRPLPHIERRDDTIVTVASSDQPSKGLAHLVEAVAKLRTERDVDLMVIGKGGEGTTMSGLIERYGLEGHVHRLGRIDALEMVERYAAASVAVVPSLYEGFSLPAVEAMSCGIPLVSTTGGALREVIGNEAGLLVPPADAGALAQSVARLLDDRALRDRMGQAGRGRVLERFTWRAAAAATVDVYRDVIASC